MKNNLPSSEFEHEDKCPSCGSPCNIFTDLDNNDECNECRNQIDSLEMGQIIPKEYPGEHDETQVKKVLQLAKEISPEDIFNDEKRVGVKRIINQHKVLKGLSLINPLHLQMTESGYGEFPDSYKLTEKGIQYIIEKLNKEQT